MSFFKDVVTDLDKLETSVLGPDYNYVDFINSPSDLNMSGDGSFDALKNDVAGIISYVDLLVSGQGAASKTGGPLGSRYFVKTGGTCKDYKTGKSVTRSMYINNVPTGEINFIPVMPDINLGSDFEGLIPGIFNNLGDINPVAMFGAFMEGNEPPCANVTLSTITQGKDKDGRAVDIRKNESGNIPLYELKQEEESGNVPKGTFTDEMSKALDNSTEGFANFCETCINKNKSSLNTDDTNRKTNPMSQWVGFGVSILGLYLLYKMVRKIDG